MSIKTQKKFFKHLKYKKKFQTQIVKMNHYKVIVTIVLMLSIETCKAQLLGLNICFEDKNCASGNCVLFQCKPQACRSDQDCTNWGHTKHFCEFNCLFFLSFILFNLITQR